MKYIKFLIILIILSGLLSPVKGEKHQVSLSQAASPAISGFTEWNAEIGEEIFTIHWNISDDNLKEYEITLEDVGIVSSQEFPENENSTEVTKYTIEYDTLLDEGSYVYTLTATDFDNLEVTFASTLFVRGPPSPSGFLAPHPSDLAVMFSLVVTPVIIKRKRLLSNA